MIAEWNDRLNDYRSKIRLASTQEFDTWWQTLTDDDYEKLAVMPYYKLRSAFEKRSVDVISFNMSVCELRHVARKLGIKYYGMMNKDALMVKIKEVQDAKDQAERAGCASGSGEAGTVPTETGGSARREDSSEDPRGLS